MPDKMTSKERVLAAINRQKVDRVPCGIANMNYFIARHYKVKIADYIANHLLSEELSIRMFKELGGYDMAPNMIPLASYKGPFDMASMSLFHAQKTLVPGKDLPPDSIPQALETEIMKPEDYDLVIEKGWFKYAPEYIIPNLGAGLFGKPPGPPEGISNVSAEPTDLSASEAASPMAGVMTFSDYSPPHIMGPFDVFSAARSMDKFLIDLYRRPDKVVAAMDVMTEEISEMLIQEYRNKTLKPALFLWGGRGSSGFISPKQFEKFELPYMLKLLKIGAANDAIIQLHFDQDWTGFLPYFREFPEGRYILMLDGMTDIFKAKEIIGDRMCIMGDVPATIFKLGSPVEVEAYCRKLIDVVGKGGGFILSSGCDVPDDAKFENVKAMVDTARNYKPAWL